MTVLSSWVIIKLSQPTLLRPMTKLASKFSDYLPTLQAAAAQEVDLRNNHKLYNKVYRFYTKAGVTFTGDALVDYNIIVNYINEDLYSDY